MSDFFDSLVAENIAALKAYQPGKPLKEVEREYGISGAIKIASNENPLGPSPLAVAAAKRAVEEVHNYPDGGCFYLRRALAEKLGVSPAELVFGSGSNELIFLVIAAFCKAGVDQVLTHKYAFISYKLAAAAFNVEFKEVDVKEDLSCDVDALLAGVTEQTKVVFLANPNNPTGAHVTKSDFERLLAGLPTRVILVVDEAYHEYAIRRKDISYPRSQEYRSEERPLIITMRTFSKIYGLSGFRIGYGIVNPRVGDFMNRVRRPFNVNSVAQEAALAALGDHEHVELSAKVAADGIATMRSLCEELGLRAYSSLGNFLLVHLGVESTPVYEKLLREGVIVRPMAAWGLPEHIRISVGRPEDIDRVASSLKKVLA